MATNADQDDKSTTAVDDSKQVTEDDLRNLKYGEDGVENSKEADDTDQADKSAEDSEETGDDDGQTDDATEDEDSEEESTDDSGEETSDFVKEFPNIKGDTPEEYAKNLEVAYRNSFAELKRIRDEATKPEDEVGGDEGDAEVDLSNPISLYMKQKMDEEITEAYTEFSKNFSEVNDQGEYAKFTQTVAQLSQTILQSEKRLAPPKELYSKAAVILGWEPQTAPTSKEKLNMALKDGAAVTKTSSSTKKTPKSKVTDAMVAANRLMYPGKTDAEIREELEPYVQ